MGLTKSLHLSEAEFFASYIELKAKKSDSFFVRFCRKDRMTDDRIMLMTEVRMKLFQKNIVTTVEYHKLRTWYLVKKEFVTLAVRPGVAI